MKPEALAECLRNIKTDLDTLALLNMLQFKLREPIAELQDDVAALIKVLEDDK